MTTTLNLRMSVFLNQNLMGALMKVLNQAELPVKKVYALKSFIEKLMAENKKYEEIRLESLKKHAKKDKEGQLASTKEGNAIFKTKEDESKYAKSFQELLDLEFKIDGPDLTLEDLDSMKLNGTELLSLQTLFPNLDPDAVAKKKAEEEAAAAKDSKTAAS